MTIEEKTTTTYRATSLPGAPPRETRAEAEADEARGVELAAFLAVLPTLTEEQWERVASQSTKRAGAWRVAWVEAQEATHDTAWSTARGAKPDASWDEAREAAWGASAERGLTRVRAAQAAVAIVVRGLITPAQFDTLTAPMRAAGVNFDGLANRNEQEQR